LPLAALVLTTGSPAQSETPFSLSLPLACTFGETCFIQQYLDHDPSAGVKDYRGGSMTYDGHTGVDLRVPSLAAQQKGVAVLAAAAGAVRMAQDGIADVNVQAVGLASVAGRECGNGLVITHDNGWETQYCHMAKGSLRVRVGDRVEAGQQLGLVGLSGRTEFPHLHFSVFHNGKLVDPFAPTDAPAMPSTSDVARSLWSANAAKALVYHSPEVINFGFSAEAVSMDDIEAGRAGASRPGATSPVLIAFVRTIGLRTSDVQSFTLKGPKGEVLAHSESPPLENNVAQRYMYVGKRKPTAEWPRGMYEAEFEVRRGGAVALSRRFTFELQ
jgi:hypothetical protein